MKTYASLLQLPIQLQPYLVFRKLKMSIKINLKNFLKSIKKFTVVVIDKYPYLSPKQASRVPKQASSFVIKKVRRINDSVK